MRIHLIAIGGAIMHQLAITSKNKGYVVTGSDDVIQEPSRSRLESAGLLPEKIGFDSHHISSDIDLVILGMHAKFDNPELTKAMELGIKVVSFPEFIYDHSRDKKRVVIAGSHGKTSITAMIMHCLRYANIDFDYLVGSSVAGFEYSVKLSDAPIVIIEGDEYLASPINKEPKFIYYHAHLAVLSGIEWDHINIFKTEEIYFHQFQKLVQSLEPHARLYYYDLPKIQETIANIRNDIDLIPYQAIKYSVDSEKFFTSFNGMNIPLNLFGKHNMENIQAAKQICLNLGMSEDLFYAAIQVFSGAGRRLETIFNSEDRIVYKDFAHSPSKLRATIQAAKEKHPDRLVIACYEMHTFSSLSSDFLKQYHGTMDIADVPLIYLDKSVVEKKGNTVFTESEIKENFGRSDIRLITELSILEDLLNEYSHKKPVYLMMTSGTFSGIEFKNIGTIIPAININSEKLKIDARFNIDNYQDNTLFQTHILAREESTLYYLMLNLSYLMFILSPLYFYFRYKNASSNEFYNLIIQQVNFQLNLFVLTIIIFFLPYPSLFFILVLLHLHYTHRAVSFLTRKSVIDTPQVFKILFPKINKA